MNRRGFLGALLALPVAVKVAPQIAKDQGYTWKEHGVTITTKSVTFDDFDYWHERLVALHRQAVERRTLSTFINGSK